MGILFVGLALITAGILRHRWARIVQEHNGLQPLSMRQANTWERRAVQKTSPRRALFVKP